MKISIVTGVGYGDEGKGVTTKWLCDKSVMHKTMVVRYGGGNQVGHTVVTPEGFSHVHHHTGSGTLANVPTFYSRFCTVDPIATINEVYHLMDHGYKPVLYYDPRCMIVTPLDVLYNQNRSEYIENGTVGVGFGTTIARNESHVRLYVGDIQCREIFLQKCQEIINYYSYIMGDVSAFDPLQFYMECIEFLKLCKVITLNAVIRAFYISHLVFEGHQGVLLDQEYGVFPHVTRSKTTCKNAFTIIKEELHDNSLSKIDQYMITRAYHTRHGNGPFEETSINLTNNECETNVLNKYQGAFRIAHLNYELLQRGISCNLWDQPSKYLINNNLVITCCDQVKDHAQVLNNLNDILSPAIKVYTNYSPKGEFKEH